MKIPYKHAGLAIALSLSTHLISQTITVDGLGELSFVAAEPGATAPVTGNTKILNQDGSLSDAAWSGVTDTNPTLLDPLWRDRATWGGLAPEMPHFYTGGNGNVAIMPKLNTTTTVPQGTYDVYVVYTADRRPLQPEWTEAVGDAGGTAVAALSGEPLTEYHSGNGYFTGLVGAEINNQLGFDFNLWGVFVAYIGTVNETDTISVDIAPWLELPEGAYRPSYHGIAYGPPVHLNIEGFGSLAFAPAEPGATAPVTGNTKILNQDGSLSDAAWSGVTDTNPTLLDPLWRDRAAWAGLAPEMPHFFTAGNGNLAIMPSLQTTISVAEGNYDVYVLYTADRRPLQAEWTEEVGNAGGSLAAALAGHTLQAFDAFNGSFTGFVGSEINNQLGYDFNMWGVFMAKVGTVKNTDSISVDIAAYVGEFPEGPYRPSYHGIGFVPSMVEMGPSEFSDYEMVDGYVNTGDWMGWVYVADYPWVYPVSLDKWIYAESGGWFYIRR